MRLNRWITVLLVAVSLGSVSACDLADLTTQGAARPGPTMAAVPDPAPSQLPAPTPTASPVAPVAPVRPLLRAKSGTKLGTLVVDADGFTLYRSGKDSAHPSRSRCVGACLKRWIPATVVSGAEAEVTGIAPDDVGAIQRADGSVQLTIGGWPVYRFVKDTKPGQINGRCADGFSAVNPKGGKAVMSAQAARA